jgi:CubicO group peptidase (beta-lactamase class C family)
MIDLAPWIGRATAPRPPHPRRADDPAALEGFLSRLVAHEMRWSRVAGVSIALVDRDGVLFARGFGFADRARGIRVTPDTVYRLASLSKPFTAAVILRLAEEFALDLDAPLATFLPGFSIRTRFPDAGPVTPRGILAHRSGLPNLWRRSRPDGDPVPYNQLLPDIATTYLVQPPGLLTKYSTLGYDLLGQMVEAVSGRPFAEYARAALLAPLGALTASFAPTSETLARLSRGYRAGAPVSAMPSFAGDVPAGGLCASVLDVARFQRLFLTGGVLDEKRVLSPASIAEMVTPVRPALPLDVEEQMGLGWQLSLQPGLAPLGPIVAHGGAEFLFHSVALMSIGAGIGVAVCANSAEGRALVYRVATTALRLAAAQRQGQMAPRAGTPLPPPDWRRALGAPRGGRYQTLAGIVDIRVPGRDQVELTLGRRRFRLHPEANGLYSLRVLLLGAIPLRLPLAELGSLRIGFGEIEGHAVLIADAGGQVRRLGELLAPPPPLSAAWRRRCGDYELDNPALAALTFRVRPHLRLGIEDGHLVARTHPAIHPAIELSWILHPHTDDEAVFAGFSNFLGGETMRAIGGGPSERICFSGYEFVKIGP